MANLRECFHIGQPTSLYVGTDSPQHRVTYHVTVDEPLVADHVIYLAQEGLSDQSLPSDTRLVPRLGDRLLWGDGYIQRDTNPLTGQPWEKTAFQQAYPTGYADFGALALDFSCNQLGGPGNCHHYRVHVTFRAPDALFQETRQQILPWGSRIDRSPPVETDPSTTPKTDPTRQARENWIEYRNVEEEVVVGRKVTNGTPANEEPMKMPNGELYPPMYFTKTQPIHVITTNVDQISTVLKMNQKFGRSINSDAFTLGASSIDPYHCTFESARCKETITNGDDVYYRMEVRLIVHDSPPFQERAAIGTYARPFAQGDKIKMKDKDGFTLESAPLDSIGQQTTSGPDAHMDTFLIEEPKAYKAAFEYP